MSGWEAPALGALAAFIEALFGLGTIVPGEVAITAISSKLGAGDRAWLVAAVALGATAGDHLNYWLGRLLGPRLAESRVVARLGPARWDQAVALVHRHGAWALVLGRLMPLVRTLTAAGAGVTAMRYRLFAVASLAGSTLWAVAWVAVGSAARRVAEYPAWLGLTIPVAVLVILLTRRAVRRLAEADADRVELEAELTMEGDVVAARLPIGGLRIAGRAETCPMCCGQGEIVLVATPRRIVDKPADDRHSPWPCPACDGRVVRTHQVT